MRRLIALVLVVALAWSLYWVWGSRALDDSLEDWLADRRAAGAEASAEVGVRGFPNRFDAELTDVVLSDPAAGWRWTAPFFQILALSYRPNHVVAVWPPEQRLSTPDGAATVASERLRASAVFRPGLDLTLDRTQVEIADLTVTPEGGGAWALAAGSLATRAGDEGVSQDIGVEATDLTLPEGLAGALPREVPRAYLDATARLDRPLDRHALEGAPPRLAGLILRDLDVDWGPLSFSGAGEIDVGLDGVVSGEVEVTAADWRAALSAALEAGLIGGDQAGALRRGLTVLTGFSDDPSLTVPLTFADGQTRLGPVPIAPAPTLAPPTAQRQ